MKSNADHKSRLARKLLLAFAGALTVIVMAVTMIGTIVLMFLGNDKQIQTMYAASLL